MATLALVQTTSATARHQSQSYPLVRPSSSSSSARPPLPPPPPAHQQQPQQHPQMYHLVSSPPQQQMYHQSPQTQQFVAMNYDYTRQTYQAQQVAKQQHHHHHHYQQRRPNSSSPLRPQFQTRSRSEEALRDKSLVQQQSNIVVPNPMEAQSAPLPAELRHSIAGLAPPPPVMSAQSRPSSADGPRSGTTTTAATTALATATATGYIPRPTHVAGYGHQPRYSAEDVSTLKMSHSSAMGGNGGYNVTPPFPVHPRYQNLQLYGHGGRGGQQGYLPQPPASPHARPLPSPTRTQHQQQPSPTRSQTPQPQRQQQPSPQPSRSPQPPPHTKPLPSKSQVCVPPKPQVSPQPPATKPPQVSPIVPPSAPPHQYFPQQIPAIQRRDSSLRRNERPRPPIPENLKRASSSPELTPPHLLHRKTSSTSSTASAPSQLETASTHSSIPSTHSSIPSQNEQQQQQHSPLVPSPLGKSTEETIVPPFATVEKRQSLSSRLKRALSFSGPSSSLTTSVSTPDLHFSAAAGGTDDVDTDRISISSTASSASIMLRKVGASFRKSRKSLVGMLKGRPRRPRFGDEEEEEQEGENKFPFGVPGEEVGSTGVVTYATAEGEMSRESGESRKSMVFQEREQQTVETKKKQHHKGKGKNKAEPVVIRGILKSNPPFTPSWTANVIDSDSRQSSFESVVDDESPTDSVTEITPPDPATTTDTSTTPSTPPSPVSEFAKSLATTLDSQFNPSTPTDGDVPDAGAYFDIPPMTPARRAVTAPATPTGRSTPRRGIQFSPKLEVHETWHSAEYDRRGEPATCNRLTAQLAQMIKDELNAFKKEEMIVHEVPHHIKGMLIW